MEKNPVNQLTDATATIDNAIKMIQEKGGAPSEHLIMEYKEVGSKKNTVRDICILTASGLAEQNDPETKVDNVINALGLNSLDKAEKFFDRYFSLEEKFKGFEFGGDKGLSAVCQLIGEKLLGLGQVAFTELYKTPDCLISSDDKEHHNRKEKVLEKVVTNSREMFEKRAQRREQDDFEVDQLRRPEDDDMSAQAAALEGGMLAAFLDRPEFKHYRDVIYQYMKSFKDDGLSATAAMVPLRGGENRGQDPEALKNTARRYFAKEPISTKEAEEFFQFRMSYST